MYFTITFRAFTPTPGGLEFQPGKDYYFISTSSPGDLNARQGGRCASHNMKVIFKVVDNAKSSNNSVDWKITRNNQKRKSNNKNKNKHRKGKENKKKLNTNSYFPFNSSSIPFGDINDFKSISYLRDSLPGQTLLTKEKSDSYENEAYKRRVISKVEASRMQQSSSSSISYNSFKEKRKDCIFAIVVVALNILGYLYQF